MPYFKCLYVSLFSFWPKSKIGRVVSGLPRMVLVMTIATFNGLPLSMPDDTFIENTKSVRFGKDVFYS